LGFDRQEILTTFSSSGDRLIFLNLLKTSSKRLAIEVDELVVGLAEYDLFAIRKILELGHFIGSELRPLWLRYAMSDLEEGEKRLLFIEQEIFSLLGFTEMQFPQVFKDSTERSVFLNQLVFHLKAAEIAGATSGRISLQQSLKSLGKIELKYFIKWMEVGISLSSKACSDWFVLGRNHPLIFQFTNSGREIDFAIDELHKNRSLD